MKERQGLPDDWSILLDACHGRTPRRLRSLLVPYVARAAAFQEDDPLGTSMLRFSRLLSHGPYPRVPTHRRRGYPRRRKARYRPAGLRFGRAGFAPAGRKFPNFKSFRVLFPFRPAFPGRTHPFLAWVNSNPRNLDGAALEFDDKEHHVPNRAEWAQGFHAEEIAGA